MITIVNNGKRQIEDLEFKGLSTDAKPTNCGANSVFLELDTGDFYYFDGTAWHKVGGDA